MGNLGLTTPRVLLSNDVQLHFKRARVNKEIAELVTGWFEDGTPLGLTLDMFESVMRLQGCAEPFFDTFDTDRNKKVDAFEVLSAAAILARGTIDEKIEAIFPIFDFAGIGQLSFDEINILIHSVYRGLRKVCRTSTIDDNDIMSVCQQLFDSHNLPYDKKVSKEQVRRWLSSDVEAAGFLDVFHNGLAWPDVEASLVERQQLQESIFSQLCDPATPATVTAEKLMRNVALRQSLDSPSDEVFRSFVEGMVKASGNGPVGFGCFSKAVRAWNVFSMSDAAGDGLLDVKELDNMLRLFLSPEQPAADVLVKLRQSIETSDGRHVQRMQWIRAAAIVEMLVASDAA